MKTIMTYFLALILLFAGSFAVHAQQNSCEPEKFRVVYGNGINTTWEGAILDMKELSLTLGETYNNQNITYELAYNFTAGMFLDLLQSYEQHVNQFRHEFLLWLNNVGVVPDWFNDLMQSLYMKAYQINASELTIHVEKYREAILQGQKVLVVSHSQGNFYVNEARQLLVSGQPKVPMESFGIFAVASPANIVGDGSRASYLTNHRDVILLVPGALPSNWTLHHVSDGKVADDIGRVAAHSFIETYLSPAYDIRPEVIKGIKQELSLLQEPPQVVKSGPVTVTLTWNLGNGDDVDLHVFEPNSTHVYYQSTTGTSGYLDVDNTQGFGPEHYYTDCNQLQVGEYIVALNYYGDDHPSRAVTAEVTISVPGSTRTFTTTLGNAIGTAGNSNPPSKIAKVVIEKISDPAHPNQNGKLKYQIVPL